MQTQSAPEYEVNYRQIVDSVLEGICLLDQDGMVTFANQRMVAMLGYVAGEIIGTHITDYLDDEMRLLAQEHLRQCQGGNSDRFHIRFGYKQGDIYSTIVALQPLADSRGRNIGALLVVTDITDDIAQLHAAA